MTCKECDNSSIQNHRGKSLSGYIWCDYYNKWMYLISTCNIDSSEEQWSLKK